MTLEDQIRNVCKTQNPTGKAMTPGVKLLIRKLEKKVLPERWLVVLDQDCYEETLEKSLLLVDGYIGRRLEIPGILELKEGRELKELNSRMLYINRKELMFHHPSIRHEYKTHGAQGIIDYINKVHGCIRVVDIL